MPSHESLVVLYLDDDTERAETVAENLERSDEALTVLTASTHDDRDGAAATADCVVAPLADAGTDGAGTQEPTAVQRTDAPLVLFDPSAPAASDYDRLAERVGRTVDHHRRSESRDSDATDANVAENRTQARYHAAFDRAKDAIVVADDDGDYIDANESATDLFGVSREDLLGRSIGEFAAENYDFDGEWLDFGANETATGTFPLVRPDGERRLVEYAATANIVPGEHLSVLRDVTERTRLQETLESERRALREMYRVTADRDADFETKVRRLLDLGREFLGVPYGFLTQIEDGTQTIVESRGDHPMLQPGESCPLSGAYCRKTLTSDELVTVQNAVAEGWSDDPAYERFGLGCYAGAEITVEGDTYGTFCFAGSDARERPFSETERTFVEMMARWVSYELEQRRATERLQAQNDHLEEFASMVSHDLRSPLNVARGFLDLAREQGEPEQFDRVDAAHDRIERIISDVLYLAREGQEIGDTERVALATAARDSWSVVAAEDAAATLALDDDLGTIAADGDRLCQLLENLFRNALEHGGPDVTVRVEPTTKGFAVEDDGPGIPDAEHETVLERGFTTNDDGTGFGLYIVRKTAEAHGWTVAVTDGDDGGARFEFSGVERVDE